jgi:hypothetical protein
MYHVKHCCTAAEHFVRERDAFINISKRFAPLWNQLDVWCFVEFPAKILAKRTGTSSKTRRAD